MQENINLMSNIYMQKKYSIKSSFIAKWKNSTCQYLNHKLRHLKRHHHLRGYLRLCQTTLMDFIAKIVNVYKQSSIFAKSTIIDEIVLNTALALFTVQKTQFAIKHFFSKCDQIQSFLRIWSHLLTKSFMENFIFCTV